MSEVVEISGNSVAAVADPELSVITLPGSAFVVEVGYTQPGGSSGGGGDKFFAQAFNMLTVVHVNHNLAKFPSVTIADTFGAELIADVAYVDANNLTVNFTFINSGIIYCN